MTVMMCVLMMMCMYDVSVWMPMLWYTGVFWGLSTGCQICNMCGKRLYPLSSSSSVSLYGIPIHISADLCPL